MFRAPAFLLICILFLGLLGRAQASDMAFWDRPQHGANGFNKTQTEDWFRDAAGLGVTWIRLAYDKWDGQKRDFLIGNADRYQGLVAKDLAELRRALDWAHRYGLKVVIAPLSLPGRRFRQNNGGEADLRLWEDKKYWDEATAFWRDLARELHDHPAVVGYNLINEPEPELNRDVAEHDQVGDMARFTDWYEQHKDSAADLHGFYRQVIAAIRTVDPDTPVMVDSGWYAQPGTFSYWPAPLPDGKVLYSFHMYEPYSFTSGLNFRKKTNFVYPGEVPFGDGMVDWNRSTVDRHLAPFFDWAERHGIPSNRLVAGEFGCMRRNKGCAAYLKDVLDAFERRSIHWAFYSFREDEWDGYDYEVGTGPLPWSYWQARDKGENPQPPRADNPLFEVIRSRL